jgi:succinate dehydrogenase/fumarate reductase cytochrome b subunit
LTTIHKILDQIDGVFIVEFAAGAFGFVALYAVIATLVAYLVMRRRMNETVRGLMKLFLLKAPIIGIMWGFVGGLCGYIGLIVIDTLQHFNKYDNPSDVNYNRKVLLVVFTLTGIGYGSLSGLALFYKKYKAMNSSASTRE